MNYHKIDPVSISNGIGIRTVLWVSGCSHDCPNCQNPETHNPHNGVLFDNDAIEELRRCLSKPYINGITFSGGDPLHTSNVDKIRVLSEMIHQYFPTKNQWLYTGYTWEEINSRSELLSALTYIDVLVDGRYDNSLRDITLPFRGSSNQRLIDVQATIKSGTIKLWGDNDGK